MTYISDEVSQEDLWSTIMCNPGMGNGDEGAWFGVPGLSVLMGEDLLILAQGHCIHLSPRVNLDSHGICAILSWKHQVSTERYLTI